MASKNIPDDHHVVRVCRRNRVIRDKNGVAVGVHPQLYKLREETPTRPKETYLSGSYLEHYPGDRKTSLKACAKDCKFPISKDDFLVVLQAGNVKAIGHRYKLNVRVLHVNTNPNPSYSKITGTPDDPAHAMLKELAIAQNSQLYSVSDIS